MAENDNDKTTTYGNSEENKTEAYNSIQDQTSIYSKSQNNEFKSKTHGIGVGDKIILRSNEYIIIAIVSEGTGEAVIYKIEDKYKNAFVLKLYFEFGNPKEEPNYETLKRIKQITDPDILKLHDFGIGADKYLGKYCYEISDFAAGGDLFSVSDFKKKYTKLFIEKSIVPEILLGIRKLHEFKIYHCDLKPSNIFFKDANQTDLLIGDYGSAKAYDLETEKEVRKSSTVKGTDAYLSPEQARGIISEKNDYYSFGVILLHLLYPEQFSHENNIRQVDKKKFEKIVERQYNSQPVVDFNPSYKRLNNLIEGLTLINHINRFGKSEVDKWLIGEDVDVKYKATEMNSVQPVKLGYATIKTDKDFINVLETQTNWYDDLIEDSDTFSTIKNWMDSYRDIPARKTFDGMIKFYQPLGKEYVKESLFRYFDPEREIRIDMTPFNFFASNNITKDVETYILKLDDIWKITSIDKLRFYIFQLEFSLQQLKESATKESAIVVGSFLDKIYSVFGIVQNSFNDFKTETQIKVNPKAEPDTFRLLTNLFYTFNPQRTFKDSKSNSLKTLDDLGLFYVQNESLFEDKFLKIEKEKFLEKLNKKELNLLKYKEFIFEIFKDKTETEIELISLTFDKHRDYKVNYKFYKSLNNFLTKRNISKDFTSRSSRMELFENKRKMFQSFNSISEYFISAISNKHNITTLTETNRKIVKQKFIKDSWKRHLYIYSGQFLALLILIPLLSVFFLVSTHKIIVDNQWNFSWNLNKKAVPFNTQTKQEFIKKYYKSKVLLNARSGPGENFMVLFKAQKGDILELIEEPNSEWYKVSFKNFEGFVNSKFIYLIDDFSKNNSKKLKNNNLKVSNIENGDISYNNTDIIPETLKNDNLSSNKEVIQSENTIKWNEDKRGNRYSGIYLKNGKWEGIGILITKSGNRYEGRFNNGIFENGTGEEKLYYTPTQTYGIYKGEFLNNKGNGKGVLITNNGNKYEGEFRNGVLVSGIIEEKIIHPRLNISVTYKGAYSNARWNGQGVLLSENGSKYEGIFNDGNFYSGWANERTYHPLLKCNVTYIGEYNNFIWNGQGKLTTEKGSEYEGIFKNGRLYNGQGIVMDINNNKVIEKYNNGQLQK